MEARRRPSRKQGWISQQPISLNDVSSREGHSTICHGKEGAFPSAASHARIPPVVDITHDPALTDDAESPLSRDRAQRRSLHPSTSSPFLHTHDPISGSIVGGLPNSALM
mmetsp:Transcript_4924/g.7547  ORF Transcript_4924/g.7547 Transcript_4924/m.7547 type:complete len:110 (-) Transcript_4924:2459-2788(-)